MGDVKKEFKPSDNKTNIIHLQLSMFKSEVKKEQMDQASFRPFGIVHTNDTNFKSEMKKELIDDFPQCSAKTIPHNIHNKESQIKTETTEFCPSNNMKSESQYAAKEVRMKQECIVSDSSENTYTTIKNPSIKNDEMNIKTEPTREISKNLLNSFNHLVQSQK